MNKKLMGGILAVALAMTACSGSDDDDTSASSSTTEAPTEESTVPEPEPLNGLDASFGTSGVIATPISSDDHDRFISIANGPDGSIYASGFTETGDDRAFAVSRFDADGSLDAAFGEGGTAVVNVAVGGGGAEVARGLVVEDDGSVLVAGPFEHDPTADAEAAEDLDVAVVRLDASGVLDPAFGDGGIARIDLGPGKVVDADTYVTDNGWGLTARAGGYAVFAVTPNQAADRTDADFAIVGLTETGVVDAGFGTDGRVVVDVNTSGDSARNIGTQADGKILATGYSHGADEVVSPVLIRVSADGVLDETFGTGGVANHVVLAGVAESYNWVAQGDDYILAGYGRGADPEATLDLVTYRFLADGSWDSSFGTDGVTTVDVAGEDDRARNLTILPDGNILVAGSGKADADDVDAMVVLLDPDGAVIETFGDGGHLLVDLGGPADAFFGVTVTEAEDAVVLSGFKGADPQGTDKDDAALARIAL